MSAKPEDYYFQLDKAGRKNFYTAEGKRIAKKDIPAAIVDKIAEYEEDDEEEYDPYEIPDAGSDDEAPAPAKTKARVASKHAEESDDEEDEDDDDEDEDSSDDSSDEEPEIVGTIEVSAESDTDSDDDDDEDEEKDDEDDEEEDDEEDEDEDDEDDNTIPKVTAPVTVPKIQPIQPLVPAATGGQTLENMLSALTVSEVQEELRHEAVEVKQALESKKYTIDEILAQRQGESDNQFNLRRELTLKFTGTGMEAKSALVLASMAIKKAFDGVVYRPKIEQLIQEELAKFD